MKRLSLYIYCLLFFCLQWGTSVYGEHLTGGEIRSNYVKTLTDGRQVYLITATIYRDALGVGAGFDHPFYLTIFNLDDSTYRTKSLPLLASRKRDIPLNDLGPCAKNIPTIKIGKIFYTAYDTIEVNQNGYLYVHQRCCRSSKITNLNTPSEQGSTYTYHLTRFAMLVHNSNATFDYDPPLLMCIKSKFKYQFSAHDTDGNQLRYYLCEPYIGASVVNEKPQVASSPPYNSVQYATGYSSKEPFGQNVEVELDEQTGLLQLEADKLGYFTLGICIDEIDANNQYITSTKRDFLFNVADCMVATARASVENARKTAKNTYTTCQGKSVQFRDESVDAQSYYWDFGVKNSNKDTSTLREPTFTYPDTGTYTVTFIINKGQICADTTLYTLKIYPFLQADFDFQLNCKDSTLFLQNTSTSTSNPIEKQSWRLDNVLISESPSTTFLFPEIGLFDFKLVVETQSGCLDSVSKQVELFPFESSQFSINGKSYSADTVTFCDDTKTIDLKSLSSTSVPFLWQIDNKTFTLNNLTYQFSDTGTYLVTLIVRPNTLCADTSQHWVRIIPAPQIDFEYTSSCQKSAVVFNPVINRNYDPVQHASWDFGDGKSSTNFYTQNLYNNSKDYNVQFIVESAAGCTDTLLKKITVAPNPIADFNITGKTVDDKFILCKNSDPLSFQENAQNAHSYYWSVGNNIGVSTAASFSYPIADTGVYSIELIINKDEICTDTARQTIHLVDDIKKVDFSFSNNCEATNTVFTNESEAYLSDINFIKWEFGNGQTSTVSDPEIVFHSAGFYNVQLVVQTENGCEGTISKSVEIRKQIIPIIVQSQNNYCIDIPVYFDGTSSEGDFQEYFWEFGDGQISQQGRDSVIYTSPSEYTVHLTLTDSICGSKDTTSQIQVVSIPAVDIGDDFAICPELTALIHLDYPYPTDSIFWSTGQRDTPSVSVKGDVGTVGVEVHYSGCVESDTLYVYPNCDIYAPKAFTPNGDGVNDFFNLIPNNIASFYLNVYDRWGNIIFTTQDLNKGWDGYYQGKPQPMENYIYSAEGIKTDGQPFTVHGTILLIR